MKRIAFILITSLLLPTLLAACADNQQQAVDTTVAAVHTTATPEETTAPKITTEKALGFAKEDNGNQTITILSNSATSYEFNTESETGDIVDDAVFKKDSLVGKTLLQNAERICSMIKNF